MCEEEQKFPLVHFLMSQKTSVRNIEIDEIVRRLNLLECHSKVLLQNYGVNVQKFVIIEDPLEAKDLREKFNVDEYVVKAQILAGGRGLGHFSNGFKGGVHITKDVTKVLPIVEKMVGSKLITKQTPKDGIEVRKVMIAESVDIVRETYFSIVMDRGWNGPVIIASPAGGTDIEKVAEETPQLIKAFPIDIFEGVTSDLATDVALFLQFEGDAREKAATEVKRLYDLFINVDATQVEINPLAETGDGQVVSVDAKINFDDNAQFRQRAIFQLDDKSETDPQEVRAAENNLNYIRCVDCSILLTIHFSVKIMLFIRKKARKSDTIWREPWKTS
ncbi:unnamed protein product [Nesidiocoris tenuis]|uniref:ATP-grasp fold succinyl-CoA synthetase-type domain-containing protein n=1 Tax=Nesidiocoris tenuis TaxID=355587 RepID=A0A6H5GDP1_9HEMI|nr:unnamed protein product [Nesidiocoris tenuis]